MSDDVIEEKELKDLEPGAELETEHHEPDFAPVVASPAFDDSSLEDEDPHAVFNTAKPVDTTFIDQYGVGAPEGLNGDYEDDVEDEEEAAYTMQDSDSY